MEPRPRRRSKTAIATVAAALVMGVACGAGNAPTSASAPTFRRDVAPILAQHCASCHQPGGIAPFSLLTYADASAHGDAIKSATAERSMPPFNLDNSGACNTYEDARWLDDADIATIGAWVNGGTPEGAGPDVPIVPPQGKALDRVDLTIDMGTSYTPNPQTDDDYRCFIIDPKLTEDRFVTGFEIHPGQPREVHHLTLFALDSADDEKAAADLDAADPGPGYTCFGDTRVPSRWLVGSGPGGGALSLPDGTGLRMSAGRKTVLQMHYNRRNGGAPDHTTIDLRLASSVRREAVVTRLADVDLALPPGKSAVDQTASLTLDADSTVWGIWPHMHNLGSQMRVTASHGGHDMCVAQVNRWDFHWQGFATYSKPIDLSAGDTIKITCTYDTMSRDAATTWGSRTSDEMCIAFFYVTDGR